MSVRPDGAPGPRGLTSDSQTSTPGLAYVRPSSRQCEGFAAHPVVRSASPPGELDGQ
jgi:hypothetical protein